MEYTLRNCQGEKEEALFHRLFSEGVVPKLFCKSLEFPFNKQCFVVLYVILFLSFSGFTGTLDPNDYAQILKIVCLLPPSPSRGICW